MPSYTKPYKSVVAHRLQQEANDNENISPVCLCVSTDQDNNQVCFDFDHELTASEETELDGLYDNHNDTEAALMIADILPPSASGDHRGVDYKAGLLGSLHKVVAEMYRGEVREVKYYLDSTENDLALKVEIFANEELTTPGYERNALGQPIQRWTKRTWYRADNTPHQKTKVTHKRYDHDPASQMREGLRRRTNTMDSLCVEVLTAHIFTTAANPQSPTPEELSASYDATTAFIETYEAGTTTFIRTGRNSFLVPPSTPNVTDDTTDWLDNDIEAMGYPAGWTIRTIILERVKNINEA